MFLSHWCGFIPLRLCVTSHCHYTLIVVLFQAVYVWIFPFMVHSQCGIVYDFVYTRKSSPRTFIGQWAVEHIPHYVLWGMVVCLFVGIVSLSVLPTLLLYNFIQRNPNRIAFFYHQLGKMDFRFFNASLWVEPIPANPIHIPLLSTRDAYTLIV